MARKGTLFAHYEILSQIGAGGMGEVFLARDTKLDRNVAIKFLAREFASQGERLARFVREARAASALSHPNIITIHEIGESNDEHYIVTEYIDGSTLRQRLASPLSFDEVLSIAIQTADALTAAHTGGITHRDIKPENIMLRKDGYLKVLDFGLAKLTESKKAKGPDAGSTFLVTGPGSFMGTVSYMSPEQARGKDVNASSDVFSFGVVLYEMLTGHLPFPGDNPADVISGILAKEPVPLNTYVSDLPAEFQRIVSKTLCKEREERYVVTKDLLSDLKDLRDELRLERRLDERMEPRLSVAGQAGSSQVSSTTGGVKDSVLLTDFENTTGEAIFDQTLRTALAISLAQSPFLDIYPAAKAREALSLMERSPEEKITRGLGREICLRRRLKVFISGSIASFGSIYVLTLEATNALSGESLGRQLEQAPSREEVLNSLSRAAAALREQLGESLSSIEKYDMPIMDATTASLEALNYYTLGYEQQITGNMLESIPFFEKALEIDSKFASVYTALAVAYANTNQSKLAGDMIGKARELQDSVSETERLRISYFYHSSATGEIDKAIETLQLWKRTYPMQPVTAVNLSNCLERIGESEKAAAAAREDLRADPNNAVVYMNLAESLLSLGRYEEVNAVCSQALEKGFDGDYFHMFPYMVAFVLGDEAAMEKNLGWFTGRSDEYLSLALQTGAAAFRGQWRRAQELSRRAIEMANRNDANEVAALFVAEQALRIVFWSSGTGFPSGDDARVRSVLRTQTKKSLDLERGIEVITRAALALAIGGQDNEAISLAEEVKGARPKDTLVNALWLPMIRASSLLRCGKLRDVIRELEIAERYERAGEFHPQYIRGLAYLQLKKPKEATREFDKILDNRGEAPLSSIYALAQLGKARAVKDKAEYEKFFELWQDADKDMPALTAAREETKRL